MRNKKILFLLPVLLLSHMASAQLKLGVDTLECNIIGFSAGLQTPLAGSNSLGLKGGSMKELYQGPWLDFGLEWAYKFQSGNMLMVNADLWFGYNSDNLRYRMERMGDIYTTQGQMLSWEGKDGVVLLYNRGLTVRPGVGHVFRVLPKNPNSGVFVGLSGGWMMQKTVNTQDMNEALVPQLGKNYIKLYDHLRNGVILTQSVGFLYMNNQSNYVNFKATLELSESWTWSSRPYIIDNYMGLNGKDESRYFDLMVALKLTWMFPLTGRPSYDYYYY